MRARLEQLYGAYVWAMAAVLALSPVFTAAFGSEAGAPRNWQYALSPLLLAALWASGALSEWEGESVRLGRRTRWALAIAVLAFCVTCQSGKYLSFGVNGVDFSIFDWMLYNSNHRAFGFSPIYAVNHFGVHANYVLLPFIPLHRIFETHWLLVLATAALVAAAALPLWKLALRAFDHEGFAALVVIAYLTNPYVAALLDGGFRPEVFYPLFGFLFLWGWTQGRSAVWLPAAIAFLAIKEDAAFYLAAFCAGVLLFERERWRPAVALGAASLALLAFNVGYLQPALLRPWGVRQPEYVRFWGQYGNTLPEIVLGMVRSPLRLGRDILTSGWAAMFGAALFLPLLPRRAVVPMLPGVLLLGSASYATMHGFKMYYPVPFLPFFFWGLLEGWRVLGGMERLRQWRTGLVVTALLLFPIVGGGYSKFRWPSVSAHDALADARRKMDRAQGTVCAQTVLFPHLPYEWDLEPLFDGCLKSMSARMLMNPSLDPWPYKREVLEALVDRARAEGRAEDVGEGFAIIRPPGYAH